jgi:hypothetical protein
LKAKKRKFYFEQSSSLQQRHENPRPANGFFPGIVNKEASDSKGKEVALFIGDTILVNEGAAATILTPSKKKIKNIAIFLKVAILQQKFSDNYFKKLTICKFSDN